MTQSKRDEDAWVEIIRAKFGAPAPPYGPGDDACVLSPGKWAVTTDALVEGTDFERAWAPMEAVGHKALAANLSDLAAMGATSKHFLLTLGWPSKVPNGEIESLLDGMSALASMEGATLVGGDLTRAPVLLISITAFGEPVAAPLLRSGGQPGEALFVSGALGGPARALARFRAGVRLERFGLRRPPKESLEAGLDRFFRPPSQGALGVFLAERGLTTACMDLSDGLSRDLRRLCKASGCGAEIFTEDLPLDPALSDLDRAGALHTALRGGEEQILLFSVAKGREADLAEAPDQVWCIGRLTGGVAIEIVNAGGGRETLAHEGFDHFLA